MSSFNWNIAIQEIGDIERTEYRLQEISPTCTIKYQLHYLGDINYEILDKDVEFDTEYLSYDEESVLHWECMDMHGLIKDNFDVREGDNVMIKVELKTSYTEDYYGEVDVEVESELVYGSVGKLEEK